MITKEQAQVRLKGWSDFAESVKGDPGAPTRAAIDALETVIALHERVERLTAELQRAVDWADRYQWAAPWRDDANATLKETTHD